MESDTLTSTSGDAERALFKCRMAESAERFDDMVEHISKFCSLTGQRLGQNERNFLSVAFKNSVGSRRASLRCLANMKSKFQAKNSSENIKVIDEYVATILDELKKICQNAVNVIEDHILPKAFVPLVPPPKGYNPEQDDHEFRVFFSKMKADYYRYLAEFTEGADRESAKTKAQDNYEEADKIAKTKNAAGEEVLPLVHPVRLGLILNHSVFLYEIANQQSRAKEVAESNFKEALGKIDGNQDGPYKDSTLILQLLRDNVTLWSAQGEEDNQRRDSKPDAKDSPQQKPSPEEQVKPEDQ